MQVCILLQFCGEPCLTMTRIGCFLSRILCAVLVFGDCFLVGAEDFIDPMPSMVSGNGYPLEVHSTTTTDGYILTMQRIPYGVKSPAAPNKPVVFLMHAMFGTSYSFTYLGKDNSLAFILADAGYDVWLGNSRGNPYARSNIYVSPESPAFWNFSFHERGTFDLPAMIDYVLQETKQEKLSYVSFCRGGTVFYVLMSTLPEYNDKINVAINMAPYAFLLTPRGLIQDIATGGSRVLEWISVFTGTNEFRMTQAVAKIMNRPKCRKTPILQNFCDLSILFTGGYDTSNVNKTKMVDIAKESLHGSSIKEVVHFSHLVTSKRFSMYDYSLIGNVARYGSLTPPSYDLGKVTAPVVVISSKDDLGTTRKEIAMLLKSLPNLVNHILVEEPGFTHFDFIASDDAKKLVYEKILTELEKYSNV